MRWIAYILALLIASCMSGCATTSQSTVETGITDDTAQLTHPIVHVAWKVEMHY